jgi:WD40 repeat protein
MQVSKPLTGVTGSLDIHPQGFVVVGMDDFEGSGSINLFDPEKLDEGPVRKSIFSAAFVSVGAQGQIATASRNGVVQICNQVETSEINLNWQSTNLADRVRKSRCEDGCETRVRKIAKKINCIAVMQRNLVVIGHTFGAFVWDAENNRIISVLGRDRAVAWISRISDSKVLLGNDPGSPTHIWNLDNFEVVTSLATITCILGLRTGRVVTGHINGSVQAWQDDLRQGCRVYSHNAHVSSIAELSSEQVVVGFDDSHLVVVDLTIK